MKKFLIPIDFSDTSLNAARYAVQLTSVIPDARIILYHVYSKISFATLTSKEEGSRQQVTESELEEIKNKIAVAGTENISYLAEEGSFVDNIKDYVLGNHIDMVIMGITTLNVIRNISCPVMIIPPDAKFTGLKKVVFISDFKDVARTIPFVPLKNVLNTFQPHVDILNVDSEHYVELTDEFKIERHSMEEKLNEYKPHFSFLRAFDFLDGISSFVETKNIDAIISVPRKHNYLSQLFKTSHTKKLAYHSTVPIIAIPS